MNKRIYYIVNGITFYRTLTAPPDFLTGTPKTNQTVLVNHFVPDF